MWKKLSIILLILFLLIIFVISADVTTIVKGGINNKAINSSILTTNNTNVTNAGWNATASNATFHRYAQTSTVNFSNTSNNNFTGTYNWSLDILCGDWNNDVLSNHAVGGLDKGNFKFGAWIYLGGEGENWIGLENTSLNSKIIIGTGTVNFPGCDALDAFPLADKNGALECSTQTISYRVGRWTYWLHNVTNGIDYVYYGDSPQNLTFDKSFDFNGTPINLNQYCSGVRVNARFADLILYNGTGSPYGNVVPNVTTPTITPSTAYTNDTLFANTTYTDTNGDIGTVYFLWYVNGSNVYNQTNLLVNNNDNTTTNLSGTNFTKHQIVNVSVYAIDVSGNSTTMWSNNINISDSPPYFLQELPNINISHTANLSLTVNCSDMDSDTPLYYDNTSLFTINVSSGLISTNPLQSEAGTYSILINCSNNTLSTTRTFNYTIRNSIPSMSQPTITPKPITGSQDAYANSTYSDDDGDNATTIWVNWTVNGAVVKQTTYSNKINGSNITESLSEINYAIGDTIKALFWAYDGLNNSLTVQGNITVNSPPTINYNITIPSNPRFSNDTTLQVNVSDLENQTILYVNFTIIAPNLSVIINNINGTNISGSNATGSIWNSTNITIDAYGLYRWNISAYDGYSISTSNGTFDTKPPQITIYKPNRDYGRNWSIDLNYTVVDDTAIYCHYYVVNYSNTSQIIKSNSSISCTSGINYLTTFDINRYGNFTLIINSTDRDLNTNQSNVSFALIQDTSTPTIIITSPSGSYTSNSSFTLISHANDTYLAGSSCKYSILQALSNTVIVYNANDYTNVSVSDCSNINATLYLPNTETSYRVFVYASDDANNTGSNYSSFNIVFPSGSSSSSSSSGGGGGISKKKCNIKVIPEIAYLSTTKRLQEIRIENNEDTSYNPDFSFVTIEGKKDYKNQLTITNDPQTIFKGTPTSFGIRYNGDDKELGKNKLILSNLNCEDINIEIFTNAGTEISIINEVYDVNKPFYKNAIDFFLMPITTIPYLSIIPVWAFFLFTLTIIIFFTIKRLKKLDLKNNRGKVIVTIIFNIIIAIILTIIMTTIGRLI